MKNGKKRWKQAYICQKCWYKFTSSSREKTVKAKNLRNSYSLWKQTYQQLADKNWCSNKTIKRIFDKNIEVENIFYNEKLVPRPSYFVVDVSRFGEKLAVLMIKSCGDRKEVYAKVIDIECVEKYAIWMDFIEQKW